MMNLLKKQSRFWFVATDFLLKRGRAAGSRAGEVKREDDDEGEGRVFLALARQFTW